MFGRIREDIRAVRERDPAATSTASVLLNYPGLHAMWAHRANHWLWLRGRHGLARFGSQFARWLTGIEIHPGATIGHGFVIDHGMGVVIGETTIIGDDVTLYQGVTLGGTGKESGKRHPTLEDCVVVGVGASVLGNITIGHGSKVGGGAVVIDDVPPNCTVVGVPGRVVVRSGERVEAIDLHHEDLPDPVVEMFRCLTRRVDKLDRQLASARGLADERSGAGEEPVESERTAEDGSVEFACPVDDKGEPIKVDFEGWYWQI
ncbi:MAG TPA: serine O-acetyltransferase [Coriobacteriia bacterium]|nr:serine O-acetyltransferase [Coriobacteriia bacterium]